MNTLKSCNPVVNSLIFPGHFVQSSYGANDFEEYDYLGLGKAQLIHIPFYPFCGIRRFIPCALSIAKDNKGSLFCIHFHGNACDLGKVGTFVTRESFAFKAHYLAIEYPGYGIMGGNASEESIDNVAKSVHAFVVNDLKVPPSRIVLIGRSVGTGPACALAALLEKEQNMRPAALILQSPYTSIRGVASDITCTCISFCMLDRWSNQRHLCGPVTSRSQLMCKEDVIQCPVLLIHGDRDEVIDHHHSILLHKGRSKLGLPCDLHIQISNGRMLKTHNNYDHTSDYLQPCKAFLKKRVSDLAGGDISLPMDVIDELKRVPPSLQHPPNKCDQCAMVAMWACCPLLFGLEVCCACADVTCAHCWDGVPGRRRQLVIGTDDALLRKSSVSELRSDLLA